MENEKRWIVSELQKDGGTITTLRSMEEMEDKTEEEENLATSSQPTWTGNFFSCMGPILSLVGRASELVSPKGDEWEVKFESFKDLEWVGSGAQGSVYKGPFRGEIVAVKILKDHKEADIKSLRDLNHENIVKFKGACTQYPHALIMEYCPLGPLFGLLRSDEKFGPRQIVQWAKDIANGMAYLHSYNIIHRDLKSPNILVSSNNVMKISDFGTCREFDKVSMIMSFIGTVSWMAPEVIRHEPYSEKVDIWSYGVVLWELLTREIPYKNIESHAVLFGIGNNTISLPIPTTCPESLHTLIKHCWNILSKNRPPFKIVLAHLEIASEEILNLPEEEFIEEQEKWRNEINQSWSQLQQKPAKSSDNVHAAHRKKMDVDEVRKSYKNQLERANDLYMDVTSVLLQIEQREKEVAKRENALNRKNCKCDVTFKKLNLHTQYSSSSSPDVAKQDVPDGALPKKKKQVHNRHVISSLNLKKNKLSLANMATQTEMDDFAITIQPAFKDCFSLLSIADADNLQGGLANNNFVDADLHKISQLNCLSQPLVPNELSSENNGNIITN